MQLDSSIDDDNFEQMLNGYIYTEEHRSQYLLSTKDVSEVHEGDRKSTARPSVKTGTMLRGNHII